MAIVTDELSTVLGLYDLYGRLDKERTPLAEYQREPGLVIRQSRIKGAGLGLWAAQSFSAGQCLCEYLGSVYRTVEAVRLPASEKDYLMRLGSQVYVDAKPHKSVLARYLNDCRNVNLYNVEFVKLPSQEKALVIATRNIFRGEELFVDYGKLYWFKKKPKRLIGLPPTSDQSFERAHPRIK